MGGMVEFQRPDEVRREHPSGIRELADGGTWGTVAGQPTDDSEMALMLARSLVKHRRYDAEEARKAYVFWLESDPFDCDPTVSCGLHDDPDPFSQSNGAMMRISPLGIFGANYDLRQVASLGTPGRGVDPSPPDLPAGQRTFCHGHRTRYLDRNWGCGFVPAD